MESSPKKDKHPDEVWPIGKKSAIFAAVIVFLLGLFDMIDRQILTVLFPYLKAEYGMTDTALGSLMSALNFTIGILVIPSAYLVDHWSRKKMIFLMGSIWSIATGACAFVSGYSHLLIARIFCGSGEAGYNPAAQSLLAASFPKRLRTTAASIVSLGMILGTPLGMLAGAYIATHWGWRHAFGVVAIPGFILSVLALFMKDFKNKPASAKSAAEPKASYLATVAEMLRRPTMLCIIFASAAQYIFSSLQMTWLPTYFNRVAHFPITTAATIASMTLLTSALATAILGPLVDWIRSKWPNGGSVWLSVNLTLLALSMAYVFGLATPGSNTQIALLIIKSVFGTAAAVVGMAMLLDLSTPYVRGTAVSLLVLSQNVFGLALGPVLGGILSDMFDLQTSLLLATIPIAIAALLWTISIWTYPRDMAKMKHTSVQFD